MKNKQAKSTQNGAVELTTFYLVKGKVLDDFIEVNQEILLWLKEQPGFRSRHIFQDNSGLIYDTIFWDKEIQGTQAMNKLMNVFAKSKVHSLIDQESVNWFVNPAF